MATRPVRRSKRASALFLLFRDDQDQWQSGHSYTSGALLHLGRARGDVAHRNLAKGSEACRQQLKRNDQSKRKRLDVSEVTNTGYRDRLQQVGLDALSRNPLQLCWISISNCGRN
jgi:hypothetical protein